MLESPLLLIFGGYLLGSIPFGLVLTKVFNAGDIRKIGSGNIGATNVLRTGNKGLALATLLLDGGKGAAAYLIASYLNPDLAIIAGSSAFFGHLYPVWLKGKGGKGVATFIGLTFATHLLTGIFVGLLWLFTAFLFRMSSLSALVATAFSPLIALYYSGNETASVFLVIAIFIFHAHRSNIARILKGTEPKIGQKN